jgi:phosphoenolpyruvate---glycerone phosphotransferase subunit DhaL
MGMTVATLRDAFARLNRGLAAATDALNALDGQLGDGDLGVTVAKAFARLDEIGPTLPDDLGAAFAACGSAISKVSSSSFGTLMAVSCLAAAKKLKGISDLPWAEMPSLLEVARDTVASRGKSRLGQKTVLDALDAAAKGAERSTHPAAMLRGALDAVRERMDGLRDEPAQIGRARIFGDKTRGMDDPGMKAFETMLAALAA